MRSLQDANNEIIIIDALKGACANNNKLVAQWLWVTHESIFDKQHCETIFVITCHNGNERLAQWIHSKCIKLQNTTDLFYYKAFVMSCHYDKINIAKWLWDIFVGIHHDTSFFLCVMLHICEYSCVDTIIWFWSKIAHMINSDIYQQMCAKMKFNKHENVQSWLSSKILY